MQTGKAYGHANNLLLHLFVSLLVRSVEDRVYNLIV